MYIEVRQELCEVLTSTFAWVLGMKFRLPGLPSFYLLSHLVRFFFFFNTSKITFARAPPMSHTILLRLALIP